MSAKPRNIMPGGLSSGLGLATQTQNAAECALHPIQKSNISFLEHEDRQLANLALKTEGRGFAMELQMEQTFCKQRPRVPGRNMRTLGAEILSGRHGEITLEDYIGETEGVESLHTFQYPI